MRLAGVLLAMFVALVGLAPSVGAQDDEGSGEGIAGTFINREDGDAPVAGVEVVVSTEAGEELGTAVSDDEGNYSFDLPGPGRYTAELQVDSLPDGVTLTDEDRNSLTFSVNPAQTKPLIFPFGEDTRSTSSWYDKLPAEFLDGIRLGLIIAMTAIGLSLIYGTTQFTNFAHGEVVTFGAIITWFLNQNAGLDVIPAALIAVVLSGVLGGVMDWALWAPLRRSKTGPFGLMTVSFGLSLFLVNIYQYTFGARTQPFSQYSIQDPLFTIGTRDFQPRVVVTIILSIVVLGGVGLFLQRARFGKAMRAVADNPSLASSSGIDTDRVVRLVWVGGSALAGLGGVLYSLEQQVQFQQGTSLLLLMFAGITLGGLGTSFGAAAGCVILGIAIQVSGIWVPTSLKNVGALVALILVLLFKPEGVFGRRERVG